MSTYNESLTFKDDVQMNYDKSKEYDDKYISQKSELIKEKKAFDDPYSNYLESIGVNDTTDIKVSYKSVLINIDSRNRTKIPRVINGQFYFLDKNPLTLVGNELTIRLNSDIPDISVGDKITLLDVIPIIQSVNSDTNGTPIIQFIKDASYAIVNLNPNIFFRTTNSYNINDLLKYIKSDDSYVTISGVIGTTKTQVSRHGVLTTIYKDDEKSAYIGNIPVNFLNGIHKIYLTQPGTSIGNTIPDKFYIELPFPSTGDNFAQTGTVTNPIYDISFPYTNIAYKITFRYEHYNTVPLNEIIASYPINTEHKIGYHVVTNKDQNRITVKVNPRIDENILNLSLLRYDSFGGDSISLSIINKIIPAYPRSSFYTIDLNKTYNNIYKIRLNSSTFINPRKTIRYNINDKLYFQSIENINEIQYIQLKEGLYTITDLKTELESAFSKTVRNTTSTAYVSTYYTNISINSNNNVFEMKNYKYAKLNRPIIKIDPIINTDDLIGIGTYTLTIKHDSHGITQTNIAVQFKNFIEHLGITATDLNKTHYISKIVDENNYEIILTNINLSLTKNNTNGGFGCELYFDSDIKLYFNYPDTMGKILGFRDVGSSTSITPFRSTITNSDLYINELNLDVNGSPVVIKPNKIKIHDYTYFLITCNQIKTAKNIGKVKDVFAKISITDDELLYDTHAEAVLKLNTPIYELYELTFGFYDPDGNELDFGSEENSFLIEFFIIDNLPKNTNMNSNITLKKLDHML